MRELVKKGRGEADLRALRWTEIGLLMVNGVSFFLSRRFLLRYNVSRLEMGR
jgi:hypothetical protein